MTKPRRRRARRAANERTGVWRRRQTLARQRRGAELALAHWQLVRGDRPVGFLLLLWPALWGLWLAAEGTPAAWTLGVFAAGVVLTRAAGCAFNDCVDRDIDAAVERTRERPLARGALSRANALAVAAALALCAFALALTLNTLTTQLAIAAAGLAVLYPFTKRWLPIPQLALGAAFAWPVPMAFAAERNALPAELWLAYAATLVWVIAYDTFYAMADRRDDRVLGIHSSALLFGRADRAWTAALQLAAVALLAGVGAAFERGGAYFAGVGAAAALFAWQQRAVRQRRPGDCLRAFRHNNWVGAAVFAGLWLDYLSAGARAWPPWLPWPA